MAKYIDDNSDSFINIDDYWKGTALTEGWRGLGRITCRGHVILVTIYIWEQYGLQPSL
jgi:hypothetical protein